MSPADKAQRDALRERERALPLEIKQVIADINKPLRARRETDRDVHFEMCAGIVAIGEVALSGVEFRTLLQGALRMVKTPAGLTLPEGLGSLDHVQAVGFRGVAEIAAAVRR